MRRYMGAAIAMAIVCAVAVVGSAGASASTGQDPALYSVAFNNPSGLPANVDQIVANAGGTIVTRIPEIGGIGVQSSNPNFVSAIQANNLVKAAGLAVATSIPEDNGVTADGGSDNNGGTYSPTGSDTQAMPDPLGYEQWDKKKMDATSTGSYAVQQGRKDVRVFVIDTGVDQTHPDIAPNLDTTDSISFVPSEPTIQDFNGHGTWTASAIAAPINGIGISGVAPNVTLVSGKVLNAAGSGEFLWTDQALVYAGLKHFDVVSASLGGYIPKCGAVNNPSQACDHPDYILLNRATQFARSNGVLPVGALGNDGYNLADGNVFRNFVEAPGTMPGWVGVSATGYLDQKAFYSNYGSGAVDIAAPGGSTRDYNGIPGQPGVCPHGSLCRLIGAFSSTGNQAEVANPIEECTGPGGTPPCAEYGYLQGTSMATPNAAGVAALIISQYGDFTTNNQNKPHMSPTLVDQILEDSANNQPCPPQGTVTQGPGLAGGTTATCTGNTGYNNFFGKGIVDALNAVTYYKNQ